MADGDKTTPPDEIVIDQDVLDRAEAVIAGLRSSYLLWVREDLRKLNALCDEAQALPPAERGPVMLRLFGVSHDVKGQGGSFGFDLITLVGNQLCRFTERQSDWPDAMLTLARLHVNAMTHILDSGLEGDGGVAGADLLRALSLALESGRP